MVFLRYNSELSGETVKAKRKKVLIKVASPEIARHAQLQCTRVARFTGDVTARLTVKSNRVWWNFSRGLKTLLTMFSEAVTQSCFSQPFTYRNKDRKFLFDLYRSGPTIQKKCKGMTAPKKNIVLHKIIQIGCRMWNTWIIRIQPFHKSQLEIMDHSLHYHVFRYFIMCWSELLRKWFKNQ